MHAKPNARINWVNSLKQRHTAMSKSAPQVRNSLDLRLYFSVDSTHATLHFLSTPRCQQINMESIQHATNHDVMQYEAA